MYLFKKKKQKKKIFILKLLIDLNPMRLLLCCQTKKNQYFWVLFKDSESLDFAQMSVLLKVIHTLFYCKSVRQFLCMKFKD